MDERERSSRTAEGFGTPRCGAKTSGPRDGQGIRDGSFGGGNKAFFLQWLEEKEKKAGAAGARPEAGEKEEGKGKEEEGRRRVYELCTVV